MKKILLCLSILFVTGVSQAKPFESALEGLCGKINSSPFAKKLDGVNKKYNKSSAVEYYNSYINELWQLFQYETQSARVLSMSDLSGASDKPAKVFAKIDECFSNNKVTLKTLYDANKKSTYPKWGRDSSQYVFLSLFLVDDIENKITSKLSLSKWEDGLKAAYNKEKAKDAKLAARKKLFETETFRSTWCKAQSKPSSGFEFKGLQVGDICNVPSDMLTEFFWQVGDGYKKPDMSYLADSNKLLTGYFKEENDRAFGNKHGLNKIWFSTNTDSALPSMTLIQAKLVLCAADITNSLQDDNPFRGALENKYGKPERVSTYLDLEKERLKKIKKKSPKDKKAIDTQKFNIRVMEGDAKANVVKEIVWEKDDQKLIVRKEDQSIDYRAQGNCRVGAGDYDFLPAYTVVITPPEEIIKIGKKAVQAKKDREAAQKRDKINNAPVPKF